MSDANTPTVTERQAVERERAAFLHGVEVRSYTNFAGLSLEEIRASLVTYPLAHYGEWRGLAAKVYPLPKQTRPRVVPDPRDTRSMEWRCVDGALQYRGRSFRMYPPESNGPWSEWANLSDTTGMMVLPERVALWADLLANPTEEVEP